MSELTPLRTASQLIKDQWDFAAGITQLLQFVKDHPWPYTSVKLRFGDFNRPDKAGHMTNSRHYERCAADIILDVDGEYITTSFHPVYVAMGKYWEGLNPRFRWGGRFRSADGNHFSIASPDLKRA